MGVTPHTGLKAEVEAGDDEVKQGGKVSRENWGVKERKREAVEGREESAKMGAEI